MKLIKVAKKDAKKIDASNYEDVINGMKTLDKKCEELIKEYSKNRDMYPLIPGLKDLRRSLAVGYNNLKSAGLVAFAMNKGR